MGNCSKERRVEAWFDGELHDDSLALHIQECAICADHLSFLREMRGGIEAIDIAPEIRDAQMPSFMAGIRGELEAPSRGRNGLWAVLSAATAALLVAVSLMSIFSSGPRPVAARSEIQDSFTEIDGATTTTYHSDDGTATVWVNIPEGEMW